jgi:hypothetical protein
MEVRPAVGHGGGGGGLRGGGHVGAAGLSDFGRIGPEGVPPFREPRWRVLEVQGLPSALAERHIVAEERV